MPRLPASFGPRRVAVSPDARSVYVANTGGESISQYDVGASGALSPKSPPEVTVGNIGQGVAVSPDGRSIYVTGTGDGRVSQYDVRAGGTLSPKTPSTVAAGPGAWGVAVSPVPPPARSTTWKR
jgi:DNA-binding beta-propeller fold protein YncE